MMRRCWCRRGREREQQNLSGTCWGALGPQCGCRLQPTGHDSCSTSDGEFVNEVDEWLAKTSSIHIVAIHLSCHR